MHDAGPAWTPVEKLVNTADGSGADFDISDAPGTGNILECTDLIISVGTAMSVTIKEETSGTVLDGPWYLPANGNIVLRLRGFNFKTATTGKKVMARTSTSGNCTIKFKGRVLTS